MNAGYNDTTGGNRERHSGGEGLQHNHAMKIGKLATEPLFERAPYCAFSSTSLSGKSQCASRISKRRCSSFLYVAWSGYIFCISAFSSKPSFATAAFLNTMVTR